ncbi:MAG: hypothetical protein ABR556_00720 [Pyrinomonadaceae bacterium]
MTGSTEGASGSLLALAGNCRSGTEDVLVTVLGSNFLSSSAAAMSLSGGDTAKLTACATTATGGEDSS